jgi:hypothetical protein
MRRERGAGGALAPGEESGGNNGRDLAGSLPPMHPGATDRRRWFLERRYVAGKCSVRSFSCLFNRRKRTEVEAESRLSGGWLRARALPACFFLPSSSATYKSGKKSILLWSFKKRANPCFLFRAMIVKVARSRCFAPWRAKFHSRPLLRWSGARESLGTGGGFKNLGKPLSERWDPCFLPRPCLGVWGSGQTSCVPNKPCSHQLPLEARLHTLARAKSQQGLGSATKIKEIISFFSAKRPRIVVLAKLI